MTNKKQKQEIIKDLADKLSRQKAVVFSDYTGLRVSQMEDLRKKLRAEGIDYQVAKKSLIDLSLEKAKIKDVKVKNIGSQVAVGIGYADEIIPAKILYQFSKENENLKILAGIVNGEYLDKEAMIELAKLPSRPELLAKLVGSISSPMSGLINSLQGNLRNLVYILKNLKPAA